MQYPIQIGTVGLQDFEVPSAVQFGGVQRVITHRLFGGQRVIESLGPEPGAIDFEGTFTGPDAATRVRAVDDMRIAGFPVWLTWGTFTYRVIIQELVAEYRSPWWIGFRISCLVVEDEISAEALLTTLAAQVTADIATAVTAAQGAAVDLSPLYSQFSSQQALVAGSAGQLGASASASLALTTLVATTTQQSNLVAAGIAATNGPSMLPLAVMQTTAAAGALASSVIAHSYLSRAIVNLTSI